MIANSVLMTAHTFASSFFMFSKNTLLKKSIRSPRSPSPAHGMSSKKLTSHWNNSMYFCMTSLKLTERPYTFKEKGESKQEKKGKERT